MRPGLAPELPGRETVHGRYTGQGCSGSHRDVSQGASAKASGATPARKSRTVRRNSSGSSLGGEWPDFSKITSWEPGMSEAMVSDISTGVTQSYRPTVIRVGQRTPGRAGLTS